MDINLYRAATAKAGYTQYQLARLLGMADSTLIRKVKRESLSLVEVKRIMDILQIDDPRPIFFPQKENGDDTSIEKGHQMYMIARHNLYMLSSLVMYLIGISARCGKSEVADELSFVTGEMTRIIKDIK